MRPERNEKDRTDLQATELIAPSDAINSLIKERWGYSGENPLTQDQLNARITDFNTSHLRAENEDKYPDRIRAVEFVNASEMARIAQEAGFANYDAYLERKYQLINQMLAKRDLAVRAEVARVVVIEDAVQAPASWHNGWVVWGLNDADGADGVWHTGTYHPKQSAYWHPELNFDLGEIHEWMHRVLHMPDLYAVDTYLHTGTQNRAVVMRMLDEIQRIPPDEQVERFGVVKEKVEAFMAEKQKAALQVAPTSPAALNGVPPSWQEYVTHHNRNYGPSIMNGAMALEMGPLLTLMVQDRMKNHRLHDVAQDIPEGGWKFPAHGRGPEQFALAFGPEFAGADVTILRTTADPSTPQDKHLDEANPVYKGKARTTFAVDPNFPDLGQQQIGSVAINNPFGLDPLVPSQNAAVFIRAVKPNGEIGFQWVTWEDVYATTAANYKVAGLTTTLANKDSVPPSQFAESPGQSGVMKPQGWLPVVMR